MTGVAVQEPRSQVRPAPHPVAASLPLGGAWEGSRCSAYAPACQPRTGRREGDKSLEAVPRRMVDVQHTLQANRGLDRITPRRERSLHRSSCSLSRKPHALPGLGFSHLWTAKRDRILHPTFLGRETSHPKKVEGRLESAHRSRKISASPSTTSSAIAKFPLASCQQRPSGRSRLRLVALAAAQPEPMPARYFP